MKPKEQCRPGAGAITAAVLRLVAEKHPLPVTSTEAAKLTGYSTGLIASAINKAGRRGYCHVHQSKKGATLFAFVDQEAAEAYGVNQLNADEARLVRERNVKNTARKNSMVPQKPGVDAGVHIPAHDRQAWADRPVDVSRAKVIVCPSSPFTARWQSQPSSEAHTGFAVEWAAKRAQA
jgi:hypothetical protein